MTPSIAFGSWPTPLEPAPRLSEALGLRAGDRAQQRRRERDELQPSRDDAVVHSRHR